MKSVVITGASSGLGRGLALELARRGYSLGLAARRLDDLEVLRSDIHDLYPQRQIEVARLDVTAYDEVPEVLARFEHELGRIDILVAGAGIGSTASVGTGHARADRAIIETNVLGAMATIDAGVTMFRRRGHGQIVVVSSVAAFRGLPGSGAYSASKAAIAVYADAVRAEVHGTQIKVTTLFPGYIDTPLNQHIERRPFLIPAEKGVAIMADKIERGVKSSTIPVYPWRWIAPLLRILPTRMIAKRA